jgi:hypothetical protein
MPDNTIQRSERTTLPDGNHHVSQSSYDDELYAAYYPDMGAIGVHLGTTTIMFTPQQWSVVFGVVASVSPRRNAAVTE